MLTGPPPSPQQLAEAALPPGREAARIAALREASRAPLTPAVLRTLPATPENASRVVGKPLEAALRKLERWRPWWYDPHFPLAEVRGGWPEWDEDGRREDTGERAADFREMVQTYRHAFRQGTIFPPLLAAHVTPAADRAAMGLVGYGLAWTDRAFRPVAGEDHYVILNGRHRSMAAWECGRETFPAFVMAGLAASLPTLPRPHTAEWDEFAAAEAEVFRIAAERGRRGFPMPTAQRRTKLPQPLTDSTRPSAASEDTALRAVVRET